jgi:DNA polymerase-3 subunit epsilon
LTEQFGIDNRFCNYGTWTLWRIRSSHNRIGTGTGGTAQSKSKTPLLFLVKQAKLCNHGQGKGKLLKNAVARVENGHFYGMGYFSDGGFTDPSGDKDHVTPYHSQYSVNLIAR